MPNNSAFGSIEYRTDGVGVEGVERFEITRFGNGRRHLRATSEMHNDDLSRHTFLAVDKRWRPEFAFIHLEIMGEPIGSGHYVMEPDRVVFHGYTNVDGCRTEESRTAATAFGGHALQNDAWMLASADAAAGDSIDRYADNVIVTSTLPNGGDGPALILRKHHHRFLGAESVRTRAGRFDCRHFEFVLGDRPSIHYWLHGDNYLLIRCRWDLLEQTYELVRLD